MIVPLSWLREYIDLPDDVHKLAHDLTMSGTNIEGIEEQSAEFEGVYIGKVTHRQQHPNADRLSLCRVDVGGEEFSIVCGAPNVRAGITVAVAKVGARLPGDLQIRKSKIRGEVSHGMICSARELGLGQEHDGIMELDDSLESGRDFHEVMPRGETVFDAEITPNRPDCLALFGIAREAAAIYGTTLRPPQIWDVEPSKDAPVAVELENADECRRYIGRVIRNVKVADSPEWLQQRLRSIGHEPINNIVDITNFVLFESGQPLHAFDLAGVRGGRIVVRRARQGEILRTLDEVERKLDADILVIADAEGPLALAGIMGGASSKVQEKTQDILLESAWFRPDLVRSGRRKLGLDTDASYRFERNADIEAARLAADRATHLFVEIAGGEVLEKEAEAYPLRYEEPEVVLRVERVNSLIGSSLDAGQIQKLLGRLQLSATVLQDALHVRIPSFRRDLLEEIDLIEEVARIHGYENIPDDVLPPAPLQPMLHELDDAMRRLRNEVIGRGFYEVRPSAFMEPRDLELLQLDQEDVRRRTVQIRNPLVSSCNTMRTTLLPGIFRVLRHNLNHGQESVRVMQLDRVFLDVPGPLQGLPTETERLVLAACGNVRPPNWSEEARSWDLYDLKGVLDGLFRDLGVDTVWTWGYTERFLEEATSFLITTSYGDSSNDAKNPGGSDGASGGHIALGSGGRVQDAVLRSFGIDVAVYLVDLDVGVLHRALPGRPSFRELPRFPAVKRDLSLVVPPQVTYREVETVVKRAAGTLLESADCFDVFREKGKDESRRLGLRLRFRSADRTLTDEMVDPQIQKILRNLEGSLNVVLRAT